MSKEKYQNYFNTYVRKILEQLTLAVLKEQPQKPIFFMKEWINARSLQEENINNITSQQTMQQIQSFKNMKSQNSSLKSASESEGQQDTVNQMEKREKKVQIQKKFPIKQRASISAQAFGIINQRKQFKPIITEKPESQKENIRKILQKSFMFSLLSEQDIETLVGCMKKRTFESGQYVIKQGDCGNQLYIVSEGELTCKKKFDPTDANDTHLKTYKPGQLFGELALLYNVPRQASICANNQCLLWQLDRETFNNLVRESVVKKKSHFKQLLHRVNIFQKMEDHELERLVDSVKAQSYEAGQYVCKEGEQGQCIYIVDKGNLIAEKQINGSIKQVFEYGPGSYFGQIALVCETSRKASIKCLQRCNLLTISRNEFSRLIGLDEQLLKDFGKYEGLKLN